MPIWLMIQIDRWLGGLFLNLLTPLASWRRRAPVKIHPGFGPNPPSHHATSQIDQGAWSPRVIVVSKYLGIGSIILSVPLVRQLRTHFSSARLVFLSFSPNQKLLTFLPWVDEILCIRPSILWFVFDTLRALHRLRRLRVDLFLDLESYSRYTALMSVGSGATVRVGFHTVSLPDRGRLFTHRVYWNPYRHVLDNYLALGGIIGLPADPDRRLTLRQLRAAEERRGLAWLRRRGLAPGHYILFATVSDSVRVLNAYPHDQWLQLAEALYRQTALPIVVIGAHADPQWGPHGEARREYVHNLTGKTSFTALLVIVKHAAYLVSVDTGIAHLAAVFQVPALTLFGPDTPQLYAPLNSNGQIMYAGLHCSPCVNLLEGKRSDCQDNVCLNRWSPEELCRRVLKEFAQARSVP